MSERLLVETISIPTEMTSIPSHLSESVFRWCEPFITRAVKSWPEETRFSPEEMTDLEGRRLSPHTFAARMRDQVVGVLRFNWETTVDKEKLRAMTGTFVIAFAPDGSVWWKTRGKKGRPSNLTQETRELGFQIDAEVKRTPWGGVSEDELRALALLLDKQRLVGPFTIAFVVPEETREALMAEFAVSVTVDEEKKLTFLS